MPNLTLHDPKPHDVWHIVIGGFTQDRGEATGVLRLWDRLQTLAGPHTHVLLLEWHDNMAEIAEQIAAVRQLHDAPCRVTIHGYSYGGGWGAPRLARECAKRSIRVARMTLCDPVYKHPLWVLWILSLSPWRVIRIPANVERVDYFCQSHSIPRGHRVVADDPRKTAVAPPIEVANVRHVLMHLHMPWHDLAYASARWVA